MSNLLKIEKTSRTLVVRFMRPEMRNPLSLAVLGELESAVELVNGSTDIARLIFTGSSGVFASGADLREISGLDPQSVKDFANRGQTLMNGIAALAVSTIAAIDGFCFGGALDLALACKARVASPSSTFCHPGAGIGIITGWGGTQRLPRLIGEANALEMFFTASPVSAADALRFGLIDRIADDPLRDSII